jgi:two-component system, OmpR family, response regulator
VNPPPTERRRLSVLVVEDDPRLASLVKQYLERHDIRVCVVDNGADALLQAATDEPDVVLLDLTLRGRMDGLTVCRELRTRSDVPILMVSARGEEIDRVLGLEIGADDYLPKPFTTRELLARVNAQGRRRLGRLSAHKVLSVGDLTINRETRDAWIGERALGLTKLEFDLLVAFAERPARPLGREMLVDLLHNSGDEVFDRAIDVLVSRLRAKLADESGAIIRTVRGVGYMLVSTRETTTRETP